MLRSSSTLVLHISLQRGIYSHFYQQVVFMERQVFFHKQKACRVLCTILFILQPVNYLLFFSNVSSEVLYIYRPHIYGWENFTASALFSFVLLGLCSVGSIWWQVTHVKDVWCLWLIWNIKTCMLVWLEISSYLSLIVA